MAYLLYGSIHWQKGGEVAAPNPRVPALQNGPKFESWLTVYSDTAFKKFSINSCSKHGIPILLCYKTGSATSITYNPTFAYFLIQFFQQIHKHSYQFQQFLSKYENNTTLK